MSEITLPPEPNSRLTVVSRSVHHRRPEHKSENINEVQVRGASASAGPRGFDLIAGFLIANTKASGVAVAILDESGGLYCAASAGEAPEPGTPISMENTISGECIRKGALFHCEDTLVKYPNTLPARSILLLPMLWGCNARGLVVLFSRQPQAFDEAAIGIAGSATTLAAITLNAYSPQLDSQVDEQVLDTPAQSNGLVLASPCVCNKAATEPNHRQQSGKLLYGLPCTNCGAYYAAQEKTCPACRTPRASIE